MLLLNFICLLNFIVERVEFVHSPRKVEFRSFVCVLRALASFSRFISVKFFLYFVFTLLAIFCSCQCKVSRYVRLMFF